MTTTPREIAELKQQQEAAEAIAALFIKALEPVLLRLAQIENRLQALEAEAYRRGRDEGGGDRP